MQSIEYGFSTSVKRSGHAACWCPALGGIVQFGGWPPSEQLSEVVRREGSNCPLFYMPVTTIARHLRRADQRRGADALDVALTPHRILRLRALLAIADRDAKNTPVVPGNAEGAAEVMAVRSPSSSTRSPTTEEASERGFVYDEGYVSDVEESEARGDDSSSSDDADTSAAASSEDGTQRRESAAAAAPVRTSAVDSSSPSTGVVAPIITVELLRQAAEETSERSTRDAAAAGADTGDGERAMSATASHGRTSVSRSTLTGPAASTLRGVGGAGGHPAVDREAPPLHGDTHAVLGKYTVRPLRWQVLRPRVAPRTRHGHHLVSCGDRLYVVGGSYWAHGNALASTDMMYDVRTRIWQQVSSLFPPRFCAALARSNAVPAVKWTPTTWATAAPAAGQTGAAAVSDRQDSEHTTGAAGAEQPVLHDDQVLYYFGGLNYSRQLTNTLYRLWLPQETLEELPQYGAVPREQFKGILVCDMQRECNPAERKSGERSLGRLFYLDGLQEGRPMAPYLRVYNAANGVWVRVCPSPDLVRSQVSLLQYEKADVESMTGTTRLRRFEVVGGMPSRRGKQRRSRMCYAFDALQLRFDYSNALRVPGLTAHCCVLLPQVPEGGTDACGELLSSDATLLADAVTTAAAYQAALTVLRERYGVWSLCCGGNEDWSEAEQNSLGVPVGWLYLFTPRSIPLSEAARVRMECLRIPMVVLGAQKDELLDELF